MLEWSDLRVFLALERAGTLAAAAAALGINATTVGRRLTSLEEALAVRLFDRTPDGFTLTQAGRDLLLHAEHMERAALAVERELAGADQRASGVVRLYTTEMLATRFLAPHLPRFFDRHPAIQLEISASPRNLLLARGEADIMVRLTRPREPDVVARRLGAIHLALYAARSYLDAHGLPPHPEESLRGHRVILFAASRAFDVENQWFAARLDGATVAVRSDSVSSVYAAAVAGAGIALLPVSVAEHEPALVRLHTGIEAEPREIWQGVHRDLLRSARVRAVTDFLAEVVAQRP
jgi:DNA-binding transcriptional LysR family regulator